MREALAAKSDLLFSFSSSSSVSPWLIFFWFIVDAFNGPRNARKGTKGGEDGKVENEVNRKTFANQEEASLRLAGG